MDCLRELSAVICSKPSDSAYAKDEETLPGKRRFLNYDEPIMLPIRLTPRELSHERTPQLDLATPGLAAFPLAKGCLQKLPGGGRSTRYEVSRG
ncbi:hypothetical protein PSCICE_28920 [Pseudomonas cichorii]|nr:hypothetical protein PSCICE_28920 [Pseudomonas cichorii]